MSTNEGGGRRPNTGVGSRSLGQIARLRALHEEGLLRFVEQLPPDRDAGRRRSYVIDVAGRRLTLEGKQVEDFCLGFAAGVAAARGQWPEE